MGSTERKLMELDIKIGKINRELKSLEIEKSELEANMDKLEKPEDIMKAKQRISRISIEMNTLRNKRAMLRREMERLK